MSITSEINRIKTNIANAYTSIETKGGTLPENENSANLASAISSISSTSATKYGATIDTIVGEVDNNGQLQPPTLDSDLVFSGVQSLAREALYGRFGATNIETVSFPNLTQLTELSLVDAFRNCRNLTSISFPLLVSIEGSNSAMSNMCLNCSQLASIDFSSLKTLGRSSTFLYTFSACSSLTNVEFPSLDTLCSNGYTFKWCFFNCTNISDIKFPALTSNSFSNQTTHFNNMLQNVANANCTVHFPSNLQSVIGSWADVVSGFGASASSTITVLFDLAATE